MRALDFHLADRIVAGAPYFGNRGVLPAGYTATGPGEYMQRDSWTIVAFTAGQGRNEIVGADQRRIVRIEPIVAGDMFLWRPQDRHVVVPGPLGLEYVQVSFPVTEWHAFVGLARFDMSAMMTTEPWRSRFDPRDPAEVAAFDTAIAALDQHATMVDLIRFWIVIVPQLAASRDHTPARGAPRWLVDAIDGFRTEADLRSGLARLLELSQISERHLLRTCKRYFMLTPIQLVTEIRVRHALRLLETTDASIAEVAFRAGFDDATYFSRRFRAAIGLSPRTFRQQSRRPFQQF